MSALAAGCYDLPDIEPDVCGNKVIDGKEDCDSFSEYGGETVCGAPELEDEDKQCVYLCDGEGAVCPPGWGCSLDGVCNRPDGTFVEAPASPWFMPVDEFAIGDVDGDRAADLIGNDPAQIMVRFGSANAEFPDELSTAIRRPTGAVTYTHFDTDDRLDVVVPIDLGLFVLRGGGGRTLDSIAYSPFSSEGEMVEFHTIDHPLFPGPNVLIVDIVNYGMAFLSQNPEDPLEDLAVEPPGPEGYGLVLPPPVADVNGAPARPEFALTYYYNDTVHIYTTTGLPGGPGEPQTLAPELFQTIDLPGNAQVAQGAIFAQVDGAFGPDLVISAYVFGEGDPFLGVLVAYNNGASAASFDPPVRVPALEIFAIPELGMNLPLATADFNRDGLDDFVTMFGIFLASGESGAGNPPDSYDGRATSLPDLWSDAAIGDFNGDGETDVAVARFDPQNARVLNGIDLFLAAPQDLFNPFHVQTEAGGPRFYPRSMMVGDYDGDLIDDVAFFQQNQAAEVLEGNLMVAFGAADGRFADGALMGRFPGVPQMTASSATISPNSLDGIDDLFVTSYDEAAAIAGSAISVMFGDSSRRMVAPLILDTSLVEGGAPTNPQQPRRALIGDFNQDQVNDFLALTETSLFDEGNEVHRYVWYIPGTTGDGSVDPTAADYTDLFTEAEVGDFNFGCSTWEVVDLEERGDLLKTPDELIGLDDSAACAFRGDPEFDPDPEMMVVRIEPGSAEPMKMSKVAFGGDLSFPSQLSAADFDDDGDLDPVVLFNGSYVVGEDDGGSDDYQLAEAGVGILWNDGARLGGDDGVIDQAEYAAIPLPAGVQPIKVAALGINEDRHKDLLVLTDIGVFMALREPSDERTFQSPILIEERYEGRLLGAGDVNGDGLTDFAVVHGENVSVKLAVRAPRKGEDPSYGQDGTVAPPTGVGE